MILLSLLALVACGDGAPTPRPKKDVTGAQATEGTTTAEPAAPAADREGDDDGADVPETLPKPKPVEATSRIRALEAEVAALQRQLAEGKRPDVWGEMGIINAHEHLYATRHLERYMVAARRSGIAATVLVASPEFTLEGKGEKGEPGMSENFQEILSASKLAPGEIIPFCTLDPKDPDKLERLKRHVAAGAKGVKLYSGHSNFADGPLDPPDMQPVLAWLEEQGIPVNWHVNIVKFGDELSGVLDRYPKLNVMVPHYGVAFWQPRGAAMKQLETMLRAHPNLYIDTSLGTREILLKGLATMEADPGVFKAVFDQFPRQIVFGTDSVITGNSEKTPGWYSLVIWATRDQLEKSVFQTDLAAGYSRYFQTGRDGEGVFKGLGLSDEQLRLVYRDNAIRWLRLTDAPPPPVLTPPVLPATPAAP